MKKFKYMLSVLALALVLTCVAKAPMAVKAAAGDMTADYDKETVTYESSADAKVYYQVVKDKTKDVKANAWLPATSTATNKWSVDISTISKDCFIAFTEDATKTKASDLKFFAITVDIKAVKGTLDCKKDAPTTLISAFATLSVTPTTGTVAEFDINSTTKSATTAVTDTYGLAWKRGANGTWIGDDTGFAAAYTMLRSSNGTLYVRVVSKGTSASKTAILPSKEAKIKVAKTAVAPTVKVDYAKSTIALKNGMEFKIGSTTYYVPEYDKNEASNTFKTTKDKDQKTKTKVSSLTIAEVQAAPTSKIAAGTDVTLEIRTTATTKKYASWYATVSFKTPIAAPVKNTSAVVYDAYNKKITLDLSKVTAVAGRTLEYAFAGPDADISSLKWTAVEDASKAIDLSKNIGKKVSFTKTDGTKVSDYNYESLASGKEGTIYVRWAAIVDKTDAAKNTFASVAETLTLTAATTVDVTLGTPAGNDKITSYTVKDANDNTFSAVATKITAGSEITVYVTPVVATGYEIKSVKVKIATGTEITATYDKKTKSYVAKNVPVEAGALVVTFETAVIPSN